MPAPVRSLLVATVAGLALVTGCSSGDAGSEQENTALKRFEGEGFSVDLPGTPQTQRQTVATQAGDVEVTSYVVESDDAALAVAVTTLPQGAPLDLDGAVDGAAANVGGEVRESETGEFAGYETRDARISVVQDGQQATGFLRVIDADGRLVQIQQIVAGEDVTEAPDNYDDVLDSLELP